MTTTKSDLAEAVHEELAGSATKKEAADLLETVLDTLKKTLISGEAVKISGFGNFIVREKKERIGRNPKTGEEIMIAERRVVGFKASQVLKEKVR